MSTFTEALEASQTDPFCSICALVAKAKTDPITAVQGAICLGMVVSAYIQGRPDDHGNKTEPPPACDACIDNLMLLIKKL